MRPMGISNIDSSLDPISLTSSMTMTSSQKLSKSRTHVETNVLRTTLSTVHSIRQAALALILINVRSYLQLTADIWIIIKDSCNHISGICKYIQIAGTNFLQISQTDMVTLVNLFCKCLYFTSCVFRCWMCVPFPFYFDCIIRDNLY